MSTNPPAVARGMGGAPTWDEGNKRRQMKIVLYAVILFVIAAWVAIILWLVTSATPDRAAKGIGTDLSVILAPILAAAAGVERSLETFFNVVENSFKTMVAYLGRGLRWLKNSELEVKQARQWLADISARYAEEMSSIQIAGKTPVTQLTEEAQKKMDSANALLALATQRLQDAEGNLSSATASDGYRGSKAAASIILGLMLGVVVAQLGALQMFALMGVTVVPVKVDIFITGLVIGSGSYPVHSLVGILQGAKDALSGVQGYLNQSGAAKVAAASPAQPTSVTTTSAPSQPMPSSSTPGPLG